MLKKFMLGFLSAIFLLGYYTIVNYLFGHALAIGGAIMIEILMVFYLDNYDKQRK